MTRNQWGDLEPPDDEQAALTGQTPAGLRRWRIVGVLLGAAAIGLALVSAFRQREGSVPQRRAGPGPAVAGEAGPSARADAPPLPEELPVPETYEGLKQEALAFGARLVERYPDSPQALSLLAWMHERFGNLAEATRCWNRWMARHPDSAEAHFRLGRYAKEKGDHDEAVRRLQRALALDPTLPGIQVHLGEALMGQGRMDEAVAVLERGAEDRHVTPSRLLLLGHAYLQTQQCEKARRAFRRVVEIDPSSTHARFGLATACAKLGQTEEARKHIDEFEKRKGREISADRADVRQSDLDSVRRLVAVWHSAAGKVCAAEGDVEQAEAHWRRAAATHAGNLESRRALARLYETQGRFEQAAQLAAEIQEVLSRQGESHDRAGP